MDKKLVVLEQAKALEEGAGGFTGYASVWDHVDSYGDTIIRGAYSETLADFLRDGFVPWSHDWEVPVAYPVTATEDDKGLLIEARYHSDDISQRARTVVGERIAAGKRMGMSIGYLAEEWEMREIDTPIRTPWGFVDKLRALTKIKLFETSLVLVPAEREANVVASKSRPDYFGPAPGTTNDLLIPAQAAGEKETFADHSDRVLGEVQQFILRMTDIHSLRAKEGRELSEANRQKLQELLDALDGTDPVRVDLRALLAATARVEPGASGDEVKRAVRTEVLRMREEQQRTAERLRRRYNIGVAS